MTTLLTRFDNLDDRRELYRLFAALPPAARYRFVAWVCTLAKPMGVKTPSLVMDERSRDAIKRARIGDAKANDYVTAETWGFLLLLTSTWSVPLDSVAKSLESVARGRSSVQELASMRPVKSA